MADEDYELWEQNLEIPSLQTHVGLYREFAIHAQSRYGHSFSVSQVCVWIEYLLYRYFVLACVSDGVADLARVTQS